MSKVTAPLLGFGAAGQIGKTQVYSKWRGVPYARRYVVPANPNSTEQVKTRSAFNFINQVWKVLDVAVQAPWTAFAKGKPLTDRNAFIKSNLAALRGTIAVPVITLAGFVACPGVNAGLAAVSLVTADGGGHLITATLTAPALPTGWTIVAQHAIAILQQDAKTGTNYISHYATDAVTPFTASINVDVAGTFAVFSFFEYTKPDSTTAYSPSLYSEQIVA